MFIENYLLNRDECRLILQVIDLRHPPTKDDIDMYRWLKFYDKNVQVIATKADKISRGQYLKHEKAIRKALEMPDEDQIILFSSEIGLGVDVLTELLESYM